MIDPPTCYSYSAALSLSSCKSVLHRRGNWLALKLKRLIKSSSREQGPERPPTPTHSGTAESHHLCHDSSSFISSDGSGGSASTSAGEAMISPQRNSSEYDLIELTRSSPIDFTERLLLKYQRPTFSTSAIDEEVRSSEAECKDQSGVC